jgi:hypothetical protein
VPQAAASPQPRHLQTGRTFGRWDGINARQRERAKESQFVACTSLLTSPTILRPPPKCGALRLQPRGAPLRQTGSIAQTLSVGLQVGLRRAEIAALKVGDLHQNRGYDSLRVSRKGGRRDAPAINPQTAARLRTYLEAAGHATDIEGPLFRPLKSNTTANARRSAEEWIPTRSTAWSGNIRLSSASTAPRLIGNCELPHTGSKNFALMLAAPNLIAHT